MSRKIWITWEHQRRNITLSDALGIDLHEITTDGNRWKRYVKLTYRTIKLLIKTRPKLVVVQNPSIVLTILATLYCKLFRITVFVDAHNAGLFPFEGKSRLFNRLAFFINSLSDRIIVTNEYLFHHAHKNKDAIIIAPDPLPRISIKKQYPFRTNTVNLVYVCSWGSDEPYNNVISAAKNIPDNTVIHITGGYQTKNINSDNLPENIVLTGYLPDEDYLSLINSCDGVMVLTTRDNCLVCGAYEAVAAEKPLILTATPPLVSYFNKGCIYTDNSIDSIATSVATLLQDRELLNTEIKHLKNEKLEYYQSVIKDIRSHMQYFEAG